VPNLYHGNRLSDVYARTLLGADVTFCLVPPLRVPYEEMAFATDGVENVSANRPRIPIKSRSCLVTVSHHPAADRR
jgi:hypothetical protein